MKRGTPEHSKMRSLKRRLDLRLYEAMGVLEALWHLTDREAHLGDIGKLSDQTICDSIDWARDPKPLIDALVDSGWLDRCETHRLVIHDWHTHCTDALKKRVQREGSKFASVDVRPPVADNGGQRPPVAASQPLPTQPNPAQPRPAAPCPAAAERSGLIDEARAAAATTAQDAAAADPRVAALASIGMPAKQAEGLLARHGSSLAEVSNYVARANGPNVTTRVGFCSTAIRERWPLEVTASEIHDVAIAAGFADAAARIAAKKGKGKP